MTESQSDHTELVNQIRNTLSHLYDVAYLQNHELALRLHGEGISDGVTRAQTLRRTLLDTLEALKPGLSDVPPEATRAYAILTYRYVDCLSIEEITERLNLSRRQVYREHAKGLKAMASLFLEQLPEQAPGAESESTATPNRRTDRFAAARAEVNRLGHHVSTEPLDLFEILQGVRRLLRPRLNQSGVEIAIPPHPPWPNTIADRALLRQALLNLLSHALDTVHSGAIEVNVSRSDSGLLVTLQESGGYESDSNRHPDSARQGVGLSVARKLIELQGGQLSVDEQRMRWYAQIRLPTQVTKTVLVIDDNESLINLFRRYTGAHQVTVVGTVSSQEAIRLARQIQPHLIVLDLMLPHRDGWEVLERLQQAELVDEIPVVVCSVLREKELALAMGASDYLTKPVSQTGFLELLRRWLGRLQPRPGGSRTR